MTHAGDRLWERFGIVLGQQEYADIRRQIDSGRTVPVCRDANGNDHLLLELQGRERMEVVKVVWKACDRFIVTVLVPHHRDVASYRAIYQEAPKPEPRKSDEEMLKVWRRSLGVKWRRVAIAAGITPQELQGYLSGAPCPVDVMARLVDLLKHDVTNRIEKSVRAVAIQTARPPRVQAS